MAKKNRISINAFDEAACISDSVNEIKWRGLTIEVSERVGYADMVGLITQVSEAVFGEDGAFHPEAEEFAIRLAVIALYTNLTIPANIEKRYDMAFGTDVYDKIEEAIDPIQIKMIRDAVERRVGMRARAGVENVVRQAAEVSDAILQLKDKLDDQFSALLGDIEPEEMNRILHGIAENGFTEDGVVKAYLDQKERMSEMDVRNIDDGK